VTGRHDAARGILSAFAEHVDQGMLPNRFPDAGDEPEYNTVDATLWYFEAIRSFLQYTGDQAFGRERLYDLNLADGRTLRYICESDLEIISPVLPPDAAPDQAIEAGLTVPPDPDR